MTKKRHGSKAPAATPPPKKGRTGSTPMKAFEKLDMEESASKKSSPVGRTRTENATFTKLIQDNFLAHGFIAEEVQMAITADGTPLLDKLRQDRALWEEGDLTMGQYYYENLRKETRSPNSTFSQLDKAQKSTAHVDEDLEEAMAGIFDQKRRTDLWDSWMSSVEEVKEDTLCGLYKGCPLILLGKTLENAMILITVMEMTVRLNLKALYPELWELVRNHFDLALLRQLKSYHAPELSGAEWWDRAEDYASLVLPLAETDKVMEVEKDFNPVSAEAHAVHGSSVTGRLLMAKVVRQLQVEKVSTMITAEPEIVQGKPFSKSTFDKAPKLFEAKLNAAGVPASTPFVRKKEISFLYRGIKCTLWAKSPIDYFGIALDGYRRGVGVDSGKLAAMWCEDDLVGERPAPKFNVDPKVFSKEAVVRKAATDSLADDDATGPAIRDAMKAKAKWCHSQDSKWRVEEAFWNVMVGDSCTSRVHVLIDKAFEATGEKHDESIVLARLKELQSSKVLAFAGKQQQSLLVTVISWTEALKSGKSPGFSKVSASPSFVKGLQEQMAKLCRPVGAGAENDKTGKAWLEQAWPECKALHDGGKDVDLAKICAVSKFQFLLQASVHKAIDAVLQATLAKKGAGKDIVAQVQSKVRKSKAGTDTREMIKSLFAKSA